MSMRGYRKPEQAPLLGEDTRKTWTRPAPPQIQAKDKVGPVAPSSPRPVWGQKVTRQTHDQDQWTRMWRLKARVSELVAGGLEQGMALEQAKRELWPEEYQG